MKRMTADQLISAAATCVTCGEEHEPRTAGNYTSWAGADGHPYRKLIYVMTGDSCDRAIEALRELAR
jgi:hypothetical protein